MSGHPAPLRLRRNGKEQSCEPCRKSKLRCDHATPCSRCMRLERIPFCVYHPAPMSKSPTSVMPDEAPRKRSAMRKGPSISTDLGPAAKSPYCGDLFALEAGCSLGYTRAPTRYTTGYMGMTGHSAAFQESKISADTWKEMENDDNTAEYQNTSTRTKFATNLLAWIPNQATSELVMEQYFKVTFCVALNHSVLRHFHKEFWKQYGSCLYEPRKPDRLVKMAEELCNNTAKCMPVPKTNVEWLDSFCGSRSRWEVVGILFVIWGGAFMLPDTHPLLVKLVPADMTKHNFALSMLECADACLVLSEKLDPPGNLLGLILLYRCVFLQSCVRGDTNLHLWQRVGTLMSALTAAGLHRETPHTEPCSNLYLETRRRTFTSAFGIATIFATFLGRPPPLSHNYVSARLPMDVSEDDLMEDDLSLMESELDERGWNTKGSMYPATFCRAFMIFNTLRHEILELSLGNVLKESLASRTSDLRQRLHSSYSQFPLWLKTRLSRDDYFTKTGWEITGIVQIQLQDLHHHFLLGRIQPERDETLHQDAARQILDVVLRYFQHRDRYIEHYDDLLWIISYYGIASASSISLDLIKQSLSPQQSRDTRPNRSEIIQNLSLFVSCLDWVKPDEGNFALCSRARKMIKHILDRVLNSEPPVEMPSSDSRLPDDLGVAETGITDFASGVSEFPLFGVEMENWFNSVDLTGTPWMDATSFGIGNTPPY